MRLLVDRDIIAQLQQADPIARGLPRPLEDGLGAASQVQPASLTFTIGDIFIPGTKPDELGGADNSRSTYELEQGHTAVIRTRETIHLTPRQAAIGFPPSFQSLQGLLMTNPGHVDPGYSGPLHCTVINMAHATFHLERGAPIMRLVIFELTANETEAQMPYYARHQRAPGAIGSTPITEELLDRLSIDFVDVEKRAEQAAKKQTREAQVWSLWIPMGVALIAAVASFFGTYYASVISVKNELATLRTDFEKAKTGLEDKEALAKINSDLNTIRTQLNTLQGTKPPP
jgi:dCTP deaminase